MKVPPTKEHNVHAGGSAIAIASEDATQDLKTIEKVSATEEEAPTTVKMVEPIDEIENDTISPGTEGELCQAI